MVNPYLWEALSSFSGMTQQGWAVERPYVRAYVARGWPGWSPQRRAMAKAGVRLAAEHNVARGVPGWRLPSQRE